MLNSPVINLAILLSFTYLVCSIIISSFNEIIASALSTRSKDLQKAFQNLFLNNQEWKTYLTDKIEASPHFRSLQADVNKYPSYVPAKNFALAVIDSLRDDNGNINLPAIKNKIATALNTTANVAAVDNVNSAANAANASKLPAPLAKVILSFLDKADTKVEDLQNQLTDFYNSAMDRVSGLYKRKLNVWTFVFSFILAFTLNVDTISIIKASLSNPTELQQTSSKIAQKVASGDITNNGTNYTITKTDTAKGIQKIENYTVQLQNTGSGLGYNDFNDFKQQFGFSPFDFAVLVFKLLGILLTTFAIHLGAPYWFDMLNKVVNIRGTGAKPQEDDNKRK